MLSQSSLKAILILLNNRNEQSTAGESVSQTKSKNNEGQGITEQLQLDLFKAILSLSECHSDHSREIIAYALSQISRQNESLRIIILPFASSLEKKSWDCWRREASQDCISELNQEQLLLRICLMVHTHFADEFGACVSHLEASENLKRCQTISLLGTARYVLPMAEIFRICRSTWKSLFLRFIEQCFNDVANPKEIKHLVSIYQKLSSHSITQLTEHAKVLEWCPPEHFLQFFHELRIMYCDVLYRELENTLEEFKSLLCDMDSAVCIAKSSSTDSNQPSCSSHHLSCSKTSGDSLVLDEDCSRQSRTFSKPLVDLIFKLMKACCDVEQHFRLCYENLSCRILSISETDIGNSEDSASCSFWDWRLPFAVFIGEMITAINHNICVNSLTAIEEEWEKLQLNEAIEIVQVLFGDLSCVASTSVAHLCSAIQCYSDIIEHCVGPLAPIRTSFIDCIAQQCMEIQNHVLKIGRFSNSQQVITPTLYTLMGSIFALKESLLRCSRMECIKNDLQAVFFKIDSLLKLLLDQVLDYHRNALSTSVLHDDESNNWGCNKPFFEDERCSFCIQMWYFHLRTLKNDLWLHLPIPASSVLFAKILKHSLNILAQRYSSICPSAARTQQMLIDVMAVLLCVGELLPCAAPNLAVLLGVDDENKHIMLSIHHSCSALLAAAIVVAAPLKNIYKVYKKGFSVPHLNCEQDYVRWLSVCQPNMWKGISSFADLDTGRWLAINLRIFLSQPAINYCILLQLLVARDGSLSKLLLAHPSVSKVLSDDCNGKFVEQGHKRWFLPSDETNSRNSPTSTSDMKSTPENCCFSLMHVLAHCSSVSKCFADVFMHILGSGWQCYLDEFCTNMEIQIPQWLQILIDIFQPHLQLLTESLICYIMENLSKLFMNDANRIINEVLQKTDLRLKLCCENEFVVDALLHLLSSLETHFLRIPEPLLILLENLKQASDDDSKQVMHVGFKVVIAALDAHILLWMSANLDESTKKYVRIVTLVRRALRYLCSTAQGMISKELIVLIGNHHLKIQKIITNIDEFIHQMLLNNSDDTVASSLDCEMGNPAYLLASNVAFLLSTVRGHQAFRSIYGFLASNRLWIEHNLGIKDVLCWEISKDADTALQNSQEGNGCANIRLKNLSNPLKEFSRIGDTGFTFAQSSLKKVVLDWEHVLTEDFGLSKLTFSTLLTHRWEFQPDAYLDEKEQKF